MKKAYLAYGMKPYGWFKGSTLVLLGLLLSRGSVGVGRLDLNIYFGLPIYFLIASSIMLVSLYLKIQETTDNRKISKKLTISYSVLFGSAFITSIIYTIYFNLDVLNIFILAILGIIMTLSLFYGKDWENKNVLTNILISLSSSVGILYGASLNGNLIPLSVFIFFGAVFFLQFSKDLINESKNKEKYRDAGVSSLAVNLGEDKTQKISLILDLLVIVLLILPILGIFYVPFLLYLIMMIVAIIFIGIAAVLTYLMKPDKTYYRAVKIFLRISMFLTFAVILMASF